MKLNLVDVNKMLKMKIIKINMLGDSKGSTVIVFLGKSYYVWRDKNQVYFQEKCFWNRKYMFVIAELETYDQLN